jgi:hypothetical protein
MLLSKKEKLAALSFFLLLWLYLLIRALSVFYVHDEIVSKWSYMIDWNFLPFEGYVDANNQFLNSLLGGFFIRLFNSDSILVVRLANLLAFPIYFWSVYSFHRFFKTKQAFLFFLLTWCCTHFVLEFFALARGYGLAWAFMALALSSSLHYWQKRQLNTLLLSILAWLLCIYANLSCLPLALIGIILLLFCSSWNKKWLHLLSFLLLAYPFYYLITYSFALQDMGKLYLGSSQFFETLTQPLSQFIFGFSHWSIDLLFTFLSLGILIYLLKYLKLSRLFEDKSLFFPLHYLTLLSGILLQQLLLNINYPEDRAAVPLLLLFWGALAFLLDQLAPKKVNIILSGLILLSFILHLNLAYTQVYKSNHFDEALLRKIPVTVKGIPTSTGGRFWVMDNELGRSLQLPLRANQNSPGTEDTLVDYLVTFSESRPDAWEYYDSIYADPYSKLILFKRKHFLSRQKIGENTVNFDTENEYIDLHTNISSTPSFVRCSGYMEEMSIYKDPVIIFTAEDSLSGEKLIYEGVGISSNLREDKNGHVSFDFTYALDAAPSAKQAKVYIFNKQKVPLKGAITTSIYKINTP